MKPRTISAESGSALGLECNFKLCNIPHHHFIGFISLDYCQQQGAAFCEGKSANEGISCHSHLGLVEGEQVYFHEKGSVSRRYQTQRHTER